MSKTVKEENPHPYKKEIKEWRKIHYRRYRRAFKNKMNNEKYDEIEDFTKTSGWLSW